MRKGKGIVWSKVWMGSVLAAFVAAVGIFLVMLQTEKRVLSEYERGLIYVAVKDIPKGEEITRENYPVYLEMREVDKGIIPAKALTQPEQIEGLTAKFSIDAGTLLTEGMFEERQETTAGMSQPVIAGFKADDLYQVVGGVLRRGDRIHIYTVSETGQAHLIWQRVFVEQVFDGGGSAIAGTDHVSAAQRINVYLDAEEVERFYTELAGGTLRVVKVCE